MMKPSTCHHWRDSTIFWPIMELTFLSKTSFEFTSTCERGFTRNKRKSWRPTLQHQDFTHAGKVRIQTGSFASHCCGSHRSLLRRVHEVHATRRRCTLCIGETAKEVQTRNCLQLVHSRTRFKLLEKFGMNGFFDAVPILGAINNRKPSPEIYERALRTRSIDADRAVFVGDTQE